jgi:drug/metabolite transporter (DMT)-like permease
LIEPQWTVRSKTSAEFSNPAFTLALIGSVLLMGSSFVAGKILLQDGFPPLLLVGWRFLLAALFTLPLILIKSSFSLSVIVPPQFGARHYATVVVIGLIETTAAMGLLYLAMGRISATTAAVLLFTNPIWVVTGRLLLDEPALQGRSWGLILRLVGVGLAIKASPDRPWSGNVLLGDLLGIAAACSWATATIVQRRARLPVGTWTLNFWQMLVGAIALLVIAYLSGEHWPSRMSAFQVGCFLWLAISATAGAFGLWLFALGQACRIHAAGALFFVPLVVALLSHFFFNTRLTGVQALGGMLIGLAVWLDSHSIQPEFVPPP